MLLLEPNAALRQAIGEVLAAEDYAVVECTSLDQVLQRAGGDVAQVALVAWQSMEGLLADEHRHHLAQLTARLRLVLMVPRRWKRVLDVADFGFAGVVPKPFDTDELLAALRAAQLPVAAQA